MITITLDPIVLGSAIEACVELGGHDFLKILNRHQNGTIKIASDEMPIVIDYLNSIDEHLAKKFPHHDEDDPLYSNDDEDAYMDGLETYRHHIVYKLAEALGDDFLDQYET